MAITPIDEMRLSSNTGRHVRPLFPDFQMPPAAAAMNNVFDGLGMPTTSESRPMLFAGPIARHLSAATVNESAPCALAANGATNTRHSAVKRLMQAPQATDLCHASRYRPTATA